MRKYLANYSKYLKQAAVGIPTGPFHPNVWYGFGDALREVAETLFVFVMCVVVLVSYPISVFCIALIACERDRRAAIRFQKRVNDDWLFADPPKEGS